MTAPALILVAPGGRDTRAAQVASRMRADLAEVRPEVPCDISLLDHPVLTPDAAVARTVAAGLVEAVLVPVDLANAVEVPATVRSVAAHVRRLHPTCAIALARPIGPEATLLSVLDLRLRSALATARVLELDGLVLSAPSNGDVRGAALLARRARQWSTHHRLPCLVGVADGTGPSITQAIAGLRAQGRRHIAVGSLFWAADEAWTAQAEAAQRVGALAVSDPIGATRELSELVLARYAYAAMDLLDADLLADAPHGGLTADGAQATDGGPLPRDAECAASA